MTPPTQRNSPLRVCLDARLREESSGGVQQAIMGLAGGLSALEAGDEEYFALVDRGSDGWLRPYLHGRWNLIHPAAPPTMTWKDLARRVVPRWAADEAYRRFGRWVPVELPPSDGSIERAGVDVMHFALQSGFRTSIPSIYVPHDLQHLHLPEMFTWLDRRSRAVIYPAMCDQAKCVVALSRWGARDLVQAFGLPEQKVRVIGWGSIIESYPEPAVADLEGLRARYSLSDSFALYPAQTFPHKNHLTLLSAVAALRDSAGIEVDLVCCGHQSDYYETIRRHARRLGIDGRVHFPGFVTPVELRSLYRMCRFLVFASRFEGFGMPILEAFRVGVPVACSDASSLPEIAGDAALLFNPKNITSVAEALRRMWTDADLRAELVARGLRRAAAHTWRDTALRYRALYRQLGGRHLTDEDRDALAQTRVD